MKTKTIKKILLFGLILGLVMLGGGYAGYRAYKSVRQARLITQARNHLAKPNERKALLCLQRALRYNPKDVEACRLMAELTERVRSPGALIWRSRVVELNPRSLDDRLALAQTAMMFRDYASATNALEGVDAAGKKTAAYHNIAGAVAAAANQSAEAEAHFVEAARLEPQNLVPQLNLAVVRLHRTNAPALADARAALQRISSNPTNSALRCQAVRELAVDAMRHKQTDAALALSKQLLQETNSVFTDRLLRLAVLRTTQNAEFKPALAAFQREAGTNMAKIYELSMWQNGQHRPGGNTGLAANPASGHPDESTRGLAGGRVSNRAAGVEGAPGLPRTSELGRAGVHPPRFQESRPARAGLDRRRQRGMGGRAQNRQRHRGGQQAQDPPAALHALAACGPMEMAKRGGGASVDHRKQFPQ